MNQLRSGTSARLRHPHAGATLALQQVEEASRMLLSQGGPVPHMHAGADGASRGLGCRRRCRCRCRGSSPEGQHLSLAEHSDNRETMCPGAGQHQRCLAPRSRSVHFKVQVHVWVPRRVRHMHARVRVQMGSRWRCKWGTRRQDPCRAGCHMGGACMRISGRTERNTAGGSAPTRQAAAARSACREDDGYFILDAHAAADARVAASCKAQQVLERSSKVVCVLLEAKLIQLAYKAN